MATETCVICGKAANFTPRFRVGFPELSPTRGQNGFKLSETPDTSCWTIAECEACGVHSAHPLPSEVEVERFYANATEASEFEEKCYLAADEHRRQHSLEFISQVERLLGHKGSLLEIGCAGGWLLQAAAQLGWKVNAIEPAPKFQKYVRETLGLPVEAGFLQTVDPNRLGRSDVLLMFDILEHVIDPVCALGMARRLCSDDGYLLVTVPNISSLCARFYGTRWRQIIVSHTHYWTRKAVETTFRRAGFSVVHLSEPRYWDPDPAQESKRRLKEFVKLLARIVLFFGYLPLASRFPVLQKFPAWATRGRLNHAILADKIGDQPVLGDVFFIVAKPDLKH